MFRQNKGFVGIILICMQFGCGDISTSISVVELTDDQPPILEFDEGSSTAGLVGDPLTLIPNLMGEGAAVSFVECSLKPGSPNFDAFPDSLIINPKTCTISGTPEASLAKTIFTFLIKDVLGRSSEAILTLEIGTSESPILANQSARSLSINQLLSSFSFINTGAAVATCSSSPGLPTGLGVAVNGADTCEISGTPATATALATYTITGTAADGSTDTATVDITINASPQYRLVIVQQPTHAMATVVLEPTIKFEFRDADNNLASSITELVTLDFTAVGNVSPTPATLGGTVSVNAVGGVVEFNDITVDQFSDGFQLKASSISATSEGTERFYIFPSTPIFRSVGYGSTTALADMNDGGSLTIAGQTATFSNNSLPLNIGVGDVIEYDSTNDGSIDMIAFIQGRASATVYQVRSVSGTNATSTVTADTDWKIFRAYTSLANAETGIENIGLDDGIENFGTWSLGRDISPTGLNAVWTMALYKDATFTSNVLLSGWTTAADEHLRIFVPMSSNDVGASQRHHGVAGTGVVVDPTLQGHAFEVDERFVIFDGVEVTGVTGGSNEAFRINRTLVKIQNVLVHDLSANDADGVYAGADNIVLTIQNSIFYNIGRTCIHNQLKIGVTINVKNVTAFNCNWKSNSTNYTAIGYDSNFNVPGSVFNIENSLAHTVMGDPFGIGDGSGTWGTSNNNISSGATAPGVASLINVPVTDVRNPGVGRMIFRNITLGSEDLRLQRSNDNLAINNGLDLSAEIATDILGVARPAANFDIGAFELPAVSIELLSPAAPLNATVGASMAYHSIDQFSYVYGGSVAAAATDTMNYWSGTNWVEICNPCNITGSGRMDHTMVYDVARNKLVLFGGKDLGGTDQNDLWEWDLGGGWVQLSPGGTPPPATSGHYMTYDVDRSKVVVFGGTSGSQGVYEFDGTTWNGPFLPALRPTIGTTSGNSAAYHSIKKATYVYGSVPASDEMWSWNGTLWTQICTACSGVARTNNLLVFDNSRKQLVMMGGWSGSAPLAGTWEHDGEVGSRFKVTDLTSPSARDSASGAFDELLQKVLIFGGDGSGCGGDCSEILEYGPKVL